MYLILGMLFEVYDYRFTFDAKANRQACFFHSGRMIIKVANVRESKCRTLGQKCPNFAYMLTHPLRVVTAMTSQEKILVGWCKANDNIDSMCSVSGESAFKAGNSL